MVYSKLYILFALPMRNLARLCFSIYIALFSSGIFAQVIQAPPEAIPADAVKCGPKHRQIDQQGFVKIGGIEQWITIKGHDCANPVILFLHGGPGDPLTPYGNAPYRAWEKDFTLVQWDQRGAGRTFGRNPANPDTGEKVLTIDRMANDGTELAAYLREHLHARKIILFGSSWGSVLGVHMAKSRPDLFVAYLGTGQLVSYKENDKASYDKVLQLARAAGDQKTLTTIEALGEPPWTNPRALGILRRATRVYEAKASEPAPESWWVRSPIYATPEMLADYDKGEEFSWVQFVGQDGKGMLSTLDLAKLGFDFRIPIYMVEGEEDLVTVPEVAKRYFDALTAPRKEYFLLQNTGHDPNPVMIAAQYDILKTRIAPLAK